MVGLILPIVLATLLALARGGSVAGWGRQEVRWWPGVLAALAVQLALFSPPLDTWPWVITWGPWLWVVTMLAVAAVLLRNGLVGGRPRAAWLIAALGIGLNVLVVAANGGVMPRSEAAGAAVGRPLAAEPAGRLTNVAPLTAEARLAWLGDVLPQPAWLPMANVVSAGDLLLAGGGAWWAFQAASGERRRPRRGRAGGVPGGDRPIPGRSG